MKSIVLVACFFAAIFFSAVTTFAQPQIFPSGILSSGMETADKKVTDFMKKWSIEGGSIAVLKDGRLVYAKGFGYADVNEQRAVTPYSVFRIASVTKPVTCIAIMQLVEKGVIGLDDKVFGATGLLPEYNNLITDNRMRSITVRQILKHQGGWNRKWDSNGKAYSPEFEPTINKKDEIIASEGEYTRKATMDFMVKRKLDFKPGDSTEYSNFGYFVLGRIIVKKSGLTYENYLRQNIFEPLGIGSMKIGSDNASGLAAGEVNYYGGNPFTYSMDMMDAHGGLIASAPALGLIMRSVDKDCPIGKKLLKPATIDTMFQKGLCWGRNNTYKTYQHNGRLSGTSSYISLGDNGFSIVALFNRTNSDSDIYSEMNDMMWSLTKDITVPTHNLYDNDAVMWRVPNAQYQAKFDEMKAKGYRPAVIEGFTENGNANFDVVFRKAEQGFVAFHNLTAEQYQAKFDELQKPNYKGWDLATITNYAVNGTVYYAGVFVQTNKPNWAAKHHQSENEFNASRQQLVAQGYKLVQGSRTILNGKTYIASLFSK
ncbi:MAG: serine hydrolase [Saprospiraceae bacterium]|nr:serine hydrolase [Saprospiraceae bacterium]